MTLPVTADDLRGFRIREFLDSLHRLEVELHTEPLALLVDEAEGMATVAIHVAIAPGKASIRE